MIKNYIDLNWGIRIQSLYIVHPKIVIFVAFFILSILKPAPFLIKDGRSLDDIQM